MHHEIHIPYGGIVDGVTRVEMVPSVRTSDIMRALGITAYDKTNEDGSTYTDVAAFERDVRDANAHKDAVALKERQKDAAKRLAALVR